MNASFRTPFPWILSFVPVFPFRPVIQSILLSTFLLALFLAPRAWASPAAKAGENLGRPAVAPPFSLVTEDGRTVGLDSLRGKVVLIDFWASWCEPCKKSFPWLSGLQTRYGAKGFTVLAVNLDKKREAANAFLEVHPASFPVGFDPSGTTAEAYKVSAMPSTYLVGSDGSLLCTHRGFDPEGCALLENRIKEACSR